MRAASSSSAAFCDGVYLFASRRGFGDIGGGAVEDAVDCCGRVAEAVGAAGSAPPADQAGVQPRGFFPRTQPPSTVRVTPCLAADPVNLSAATSASASRHCASVYRLYFFFGRRLADRLTAI